MRWPINRFLGSGLVSLALLFWSGCGINGDHACCDHDHDHGHAHDHGHSPASEETGADPSSIDVSGHTHTGPNGGRLIVLGDEDYHAELVIDHASGEVTVRILDRTGRKPVGIEQRTITLNFKSQGRPYQIQLVAMDCLEGQAGESSCFSGTSDCLRGECELTGRLNLVIGGKPYTGRVAHHEVDHQLIR